MTEIKSTVRSTTTLPLGEDGDTNRRIVLGIKAVPNSKYNYSPLAEFVVDSKNMEEAKELCIKHVEQFIDFIIENNLEETKIKGESE